MNRREPTPGPSNPYFDTMTVEGYVVNGSVGFRIDDGVIKCNWFGGAIMAIANQLIQENLEVEPGVLAIRTSQDGTRMVCGPYLLELIYAGQQNTVTRYIGTAQSMDDLDRFLSGEPWTDPIEIDPSEYVFAPDNVGPAESAGKEPNP